MNVIQIAIGRFHHFHLARQLERHGLLGAIWTGYPKFRLKDEYGIPKEKIRTFPWLHTPYMFGGKLGLHSSTRIKKQIEWWAHETLDYMVAAQLDNPAIVVALSSCGLRSGVKVKRLGGLYICDRGSSHIRYQNEILREEHKIWGIQYDEIDPRIIEKEEQEYLLSDLITVPSGFAEKTFLQSGISGKKIAKIPYGANLIRFKKFKDPSVDSFQILWVGNVSLQKGFLYLLDAFNSFKHPNKKLIVVGALSAELKPLLTKRPLNGVEFKGIIENKQLVNLYNSSHVFVLPSVQEGLAMVLCEALACGCPIIASENTGAHDLIKDGVEGFIVPIRSANHILMSFQKLTDSNHLRSEMSSAALNTVQKMNGWDNYGDQFVKSIQRLKSEMPNTETSTPSV